MKKITETVTKEVTTYEAFDGKVFNDAFACAFYEWKEREAISVYQVYRRGDRSDNIELYSTKELAEDAIIGHKSHYIISRINIDERFNHKRLLEQHKGK